MYLDHFTHPKCFKYPPNLFEVDHASMANASILFSARDPNNTNKDETDTSVLSMSALMDDAAEDLDGASSKAVKVSSKHFSLMKIRALKRP